MPSVYVSWGGTCTDHDTQTALVTDLATIAAASEARIRDKAPERPEILVKTAAMRGEGKLDLPAVRTWNRAVRGDILVGPGVAADPAGAVEEASRLGAEQVMTGADYGLIRVESLRLFGLDFRLFDPRGLYPNEDRVSFVFLGCPELPALDGRIARVIDHAEAQLYDADAIRSADWVVTAPDIHLRYYLEEWSTQLLAWVKYFFVPDLGYWRGQTLAGWDEAREGYDRAVASSSRDLVRRVALGPLLDGFEAEAEMWIARMAGW
jgi:hypothetical protein